jgi:hypothetical protein
MPWDATVILALSVSSRNYRLQPLHRPWSRRKVGGCDTRPFAPLPPFRAGRSRAYHERLVAQIHTEEAKLVEYLGGILRDLDRRILVCKAGAATRSPTSACAAMPRDYGLTVDQVNVALDANPLRSTATGS